MNPRTRHFPRSILRSGALLLLLLCLVAQPVLAAWGQMHELIAHADSTTTVDHAAAHAHDDVDAHHPPGGDENGDPIHTLSHHAHCCGQPQLPFPPQWALPAFHCAAMTPWPAKARPVAASHSATPFRPPIAG